jgi:hypothetical protein
VGVVVHTLHFQEFGMIEAFKTILAQGAPWLPAIPTKDAVYSVSFTKPKPVSARLGMKYRPRTQREPRSSTPEIQKALRNYLANNPGHNITHIHKALGWSISKTERVMTELREEIGNGHFLKANLRVGINE